MSDEELTTSADFHNTEMPFTRLQRIITGESSKAAKIKNRTRPSLKVKAQKIRKSRTSGKLALMMQMPMEVFCEIAGHLNPLDLLHLSRSTKDLRDLLMSRTARLIWRTTMRAMEIPESPGDINEPQLISLLFETFCQGCGAPGVKKVDYGLRVRLCPGCFSLNVVQGCKVVDDINGVSSTDYAVYRLCCFEKASAFGPQQNGLMSWPDEILARQKFFIPDLTDAIRQYKLYDAGSEGQKQFLERRKELITKICEHTVAIHKWESQQSLVKANDGHMKRKSRMESILKRLKELGYTDEDLASNGISYSSEWRSILWQPRELTERIWKSILPQLQVIITTRRRERAEKALSALRDQRWSEFRSFYKQFIIEWKELEGSNPEMLFEDLQEHPEIKALVDKYESKASLREGDWTEVEYVVFRVVQNHESQMSAECVDLIIRSRQSAGLPLFSAERNANSDDLLHLASSFILWKEFSLFSPSLYTFEDFLDLRRNAVYRALNDGKPPTPSVTPTILKVACALIRSLGLADSISMAEMEGFGPSFVCKCCDPVHRRKMTWKDLVYHFECKAKFSNVVPRELAGSPDVGIGSDHNLDNRADLAELELREALSGTADEGTPSTSQYSSQPSEMKSALGRSN